MDKQTARRLELVASYTNNGVLITDPNGVTVWLNQEIERQTGYSADELIGQKPGQILQGRETSSESVELMRAALANREPFETTVANYSKNGLLYWVRISCRPFYRENGELEGFISTQVDVTRLRRLSDFNMLHAAVNQVIAQSQDDLSLFQSICDLAVRHAHLELAWIGRPDETGRLEFLACAGRAVGYLDGFIISVDSDIPEGQGPSGMTWREGVANYSQSFSMNASLKPWQKRARSFGLDASATMPIFRNGEVWALFSGYHARSGIFDRELCEVLDALARDISHGLDQIDLRKRERDLAKQLYQEKELAQVTLLSIEDAVITTDQSGRITFLNPKAMILTGWGEEDACGRALTQVLRLFDDQDASRPCDPFQEILSTREAVYLGNQTILVGRDGSSRHIESSASPIFTQDGDLRGGVIIFRDVTERYEASRKLMWQAKHDSLTGLPNRFALEQHLQQSIANARANDTRLAVGLLDLDDFKPVNDRYGHEMGDRLLIELARRLEARQRTGDFLARLAGDELVVVIGNLEPQHSGEELEAIFARLHEVVEEPFDLAAGVRVVLGMSMGVATYPDDGEDPDGLLRQADAAMYSAKTNKYNRAMWWRHAMFSLPKRADEDKPIDPYGEVAADLLGKTSPQWVGVEEEFVEAFYERLQQLPSANQVLSLLTDDELKQLKILQSEHFKRLISPDLRLETHQQVARHVGEVHAMIGVESSAIIAAMDDYGRLLRYASQKLPWRTDARLALDSIMQSRLAAEIQLQSKGRDTIEQARIANITGLEMRVQSWIADGEFPLRVTQHLSSMPCICAVMIGRPDERDQFVLEFKAGKLAASMHGFPREVQTAAADAGQQASHPWRKAWVSGRIEVCERFYAETDGSGQGATAQARRIRSAAYVPILDPHGHSLVLIALFGEYPGQFTHTSTMRMWLESVQHAITPVFWHIEKVGQDPIDTATRQHYHRLLFEDRLQIVVHPIVTLATGSVEKVEVLARLRDSDNLLIPAAFLPSFGKQDLQALFRKGMRQTLDWMERWDEQGCRVQANLNLPPSVLVSPDCLVWVAEELDAHTISPERLYLELLETEDDSSVPELRDQAISRLAELGVRLIMDDLGSGYSSLQRMRMLPFHSVKIDQQLVRYAPSEPKRTVPFIGALIRMAQSLDLEVVVEGLEDMELVDMAARLGADYGQGYAFSQPFLPETLPQWIDDWHASPAFARLNKPRDERT